ncbi:Gp15 family bacteriophage protein [Sporosarcina sp. FSL K6-3457]|uniref:Gp15 family bacteriophage protein n=1 Tax=Sporosarcina sp. FSL K6-3457 TaxID=2978204 RepID=UPI0030FA674B
MRLNTPLVTSFVFDGHEYEIDLAFDNVLSVFSVFDEIDLRDYEKADIALALLIGVEYKSNTNDLWNFVYGTFIHVEDKRSIEYDRQGNPMPIQKEPKKSIDFEKDAEYIYASFRQAYNINLYQEQGKLSWAEFKALLSGLPSDTVMQRVIQIRLWEPSKGESSEYKQAMKELQKTYALEELEEE